MKLPNSASSGLLFAQALVELNGAPQNSNRKARLLLRSARAALLAGLIAIGCGVPAAQAQQITRPIPPQAKLGMLSALQLPYVRMDDTALRLAPSAIIRDGKNHVVLPAQLAQRIGPGAALTAYQLDLRGQLQNAWILNREESQRFRP